MLSWRRLFGRGPAPPAVDDDAIRVLLVCLGNLCRSPLAEGLLRDRVDRAGLARRIVVDSAGTHGQRRGGVPDPRAVRCAAQHGIDLSRLRARGVTADDYTRFDWLLAMDETNLAWLRDHAPPGATARLGLLMAHARRHAGIREVPDPYYGAPEGFDRVWDLVDDACEGLVEDLAASAGGPLAEMRAGLPASGSLCAASGPATPVPPSAMLD